MTIRYMYDCNSCGIDYTEQRTESEPQYITKCSCGGNFVFQSEQQITE
jgi:uncharacterized protein (DUF983 family)